MRASDVLARGARGRAPSSAERQWGPPRDSCSCRARRSLSATASPRTERLPWRRQDHAGRRVLATRSPPRERSSRPGPASCPNTSLRPAVNGSPFARVRDPARTRRRGFRILRHEQQSRVDHETASPRASGHPAGSRRTGRHAGIRMSAAGLVAAVPANVEDDLDRVWDGQSESCGCRLQTPEGADERREFFGDA